MSQILDRDMLNELWPVMTPEERAEAERLLATMPPPMELRDYIRAAWHVVEPATTYVHGWHIDAISELLMAITRGEVRNAAINIPPRHMKSLTVCVFWMTWTWTFAPASRWIFGSYSDQLAIRDSLKCRTIIQSKWYQDRWGNVFQLSGEQNQKARFDNDRTGYRISTGVTGGATGEGADFIVVDDPLKALDAESEIALETAAEWWDKTMSTRVNDPETVAKLIIMQRLNALDLTGHIMSAMRDGGEPYELLILPAEYEPNRMTVMPNCPWRDPRSEEGEPLWPQRFTKERIQQWAKTLGDAAAGQLQQRPSPPGGAIYKAEWWAGGRNRYHVEDKELNAQVIARYLSVDTALKDNESNDYSVCEVYELLADYRLRLRHLWKERLTFPSLVRDITATATDWNRDGLLDAVIIEDKVSGTSAIQTLREGAPEWLAMLIVDFSPGGSKTYRARQASFWCEHDCVLLPHPSPDVPWLLNFEQDRDDFPRGEHDDTVDPLSQVIIYLEHLLAVGWHGRGGSDVMA